MFRPLNFVNLGEAQWPIGYGIGLRIKRSSVRIQPWPQRWVLGQGSLLPLSQGEAFTLASISYLAILVKYMLAKKKKKKKKNLKKSWWSLIIVVLMFWWCLSIEPYHEKRDTNDVFFFKTEILMRLDWYFLWKILGKNVQLCPSFLQRYATLCYTWIIYFTLACTTLTGCDILFCVPFLDTAQSLIRFWSPQCSAFFSLCSTMQKLRRAAANSHTLVKRRDCSVPSSLVTPQHSTHACDLSFVWWERPGCKAQPGRRWEESTAEIKTVEYRIGPESRRFWGDEQHQAQQHRSPSLFHDPSASQPRPVDVLVA